MSFPSLPPITFKLNKRNERKKAIKKKKICYKLLLRNSYNSENIQLYLE